MRLVESASEVGEAINEAKADASGYCSNFFPSTRKLQGWISHGELFCEQRDGAVLFLTEGSRLLASLFLRCQPDVTPAGRYRASDAWNRTGGS